MNKKYIVLFLLLCASLSQSILASIEKIYEDNHQFISTCYKKNEVQVVEMFNKITKIASYFGFINGKTILNEDAQHQFKKLKKEYVGQRLGIINPFEHETKILLYSLKSRL